MLGRPVKLLARISDGLLMLTVPLAAREDVSAKIPDCVPLVLIDNPPMDAAISNVCVERLDCTT